MLHTSTHKFDRTNAIIAVAVTTATLVVYTLTKAATVSLWDCGEFIACSVILGIPHPPGTPFYIMVGRIFSLIPIFADVSARLNFLSVLCSSLAALFGYLSIVRLLRPWLGSDGTSYGKALMYLAAASGTLLLAFGRTAWTNAIETEVYGMSMLFMFAIVWLTLIYYEKRGTLAGERILVAIVYLAFLGISVHMTTFLIFPAALIVLVFKKDTPVNHWFILAAWFVVELFLVFALSSRPGELPWYLPIVIVMVIYLFYVLSFEVIPRSLLYIGVGLLISCLPLVALRRPDLAGATGAIATVSFILVLLYSLYILAGSRKGPSAKRQDRRRLMVGAAFPLAGAVMVVILLAGIKGYGAFLFITLTLAFVVAVLVWKSIELPILLAVGATSLVIVGLRLALWGTIVAAVAILLLGLLVNMPRWRTALAAVLFAVLGFSTHLFVPIRSAQHPFINENNPSQNTTALVNFLERKQYGSQGMVERMFKRRAEWSNQFGMHRRMGFWQFFDEQFGLSGPKFFLIFVIGLFGMWEIVRRGPPTGLFVLILLLVSTVGLVLYMNFADGTRINPTTGRDYLEVRDRDYFFTAGFMVYGLAIGIGAGALVQFIRDSVRKFSPGIKRLILAACLVLFGLPVYAAAGNWYYCDRSNNYVAYDYAWNLLHSADPNAAFFTGGDNDTFPLWCLQEAYGIRKDVRNVNLSLANTKWYIKQVQDYMGLNLGWTEEEIDSLMPYRLPDGRVFRLQDQVVDAIIKNNPDVPINFSITTTSSSRKFEGRPIDNKLVVSGMKHRYDPEATELRVAVDEAQSYFGDTAQFRYARMADPTFYKNEATLRVIANVANSLSMSAEGAISSGYVDEAKTFLKQALHLRPESGSAVARLASIYAGYGQLDSIRAIETTFPQADRREINLALAKAYRGLDDEARAREILNDLLTASPTWRPALDEMMRSLVKARDVDGMVALLNRWLQFNPGDHQMRQALNDLIRQLEQLSDTNRSAG
ncbi:MAG: DUF2723 domain-containing protein [Candidatus Zixiibacteriota bacterium]|nr:MAG: DUF2723 domain-containing protein [candidate division Zixibacteria bacterium]